MERGSAKHGARLDDQQKHETEGMVRGAGATHAEEWKQPEPTHAAGEEGLAPPARPPGHEPGAPHGITPADVERRSNLAKWLSDAEFPADREELITHAEEVGAPDPVIEAVNALPDLQFANISEVAQALGLGVEAERW
ncbi:hypothetical protein HNP84_006110 [Thermocatellispora tengchongensis]|uniref:DUF2795 domain-containing protein n=1 Tax=Thermocatellispora tengchongensis TaxID=1073253 RepID=A0A840PEJ8_9ACTN|nr:DUF2795 domain-containing protein [Thermocatellispora tengchongensis]MBB5136363.1 hypothetical protein [Thermocatellispora tengchongensis]